MTKNHLKEGTTNKMGIPKVAMSLHEEKSSLGLIEDVRQ